MKVTIHQPEHACWLGLIDKISKADVFVIMDEVQFEKNYFQNRNKIRTKIDWTWLTVPVEKHNHKPINQVKIANETNWRSKYLGLLKENYGKSINFKKYYATIESIISKDWVYLSDLNIELLKFFLAEFNVTTKVILMSELNLPAMADGTEKCLQICKAVSATTYLSGTSGRDYLDVTKFTENNIKVEFHDFFHYPYDLDRVGLSVYDCLFTVKDINYTLHDSCKGIKSLVKILSSISLSKHLSILEVFGGDGFGHLKGYANDYSDVSIWDINLINCEMLKAHYSKASINCVNSLEYSDWLVKNTNIRYDIVIVDTPAQLSNDLILAKAANLIHGEGYLIVRYIKQPYKEHESVVRDLPLSEMSRQIGDQYDILESWLEPREYYFLNDWLYNAVFHIKRKS
jgi:hypothetical protein